MNGCEHDEQTLGTLGGDSRSSSHLAQVATLVVRYLVAESAAARVRFEEAAARVPGLRDARIRGPSSMLVREAPERERTVIPLASGGGETLELLWRSEADRLTGQRVADGLALIASMVVHAERLMASTTEAAANRGGAVRVILGTSDATNLLRQRIDKVARTDFSVLIEGESGVGKELVARQIHDRSRRRKGPFVAVNCAAIVETLVEAELFGIEDRTATGVRGRRGKFEHADGGTLFLDEIADLSLAAQAKLLRTLQELSVERVGGQSTHPVNARIIVATNRSLAQLVEEGRFRVDLFYRLNCLEIRVPPLRARPEDILVLAHAILARHSDLGQLTLSQEALDALMSYDWPGNVRELERTLERAITLSDSTTIDIDDLPPSITRTFREVLYPSLLGNDTLRSWGGRYAKLVLARAGNNKREACRRLGISYHTLQGYLADESRRAEHGATRPKLPTSTGCEEGTNV